MVGAVNNGVNENWVLAAQRREPCPYGSPRPYAFLVFPLPLTCTREAANYF